MNGIRSNVSLAQLQETMRSQPLTSLRVNKEGNGVDKGFAARGFGGKIVYAIRLAFQAIGIGRDPTRAARQAAGLDEFRAMIRDRYPATLAAAASDKLEKSGTKGRNIVSVLNGLVSDSQRLQNAADDAARGVSPNGIASGNRSDLKKVLADVGYPKGMDGKQVAVFESVYGEISRGLINHHAMNNGVDFSGKIPLPTGDETPQMAAPSKPTRGQAKLDAKIASTAARVAKAVAQNPAAYDQFQTQKTEAGRHLSTLAAGMTFPDPAPKDLAMHLAKFNQQIGRTMSALRTADPNLSQADLAETQRGLEQNLFASARSGLANARSRDHASSEQIKIGEVFRNNAKPFAAVLAAANIAQVQAPRLANGNENFAEAMRLQSSPRSLVDFYDSCLRSDPVGGKDALRPAWLDAAAQRLDTDQAELMRMSGDTDVHGLAEILTADAHEW